MAFGKGNKVLKFPPAEAPAAKLADDDYDWSLLERIGSGDEPAFEIFYKRYRRYLERFIYQITRRVELIDDVISEVMLVVWQQAGRTERRARASTWLLGIANFKSLHALRKAARGLGTGSIAEEPGDNGRALRVVEQDDLLHVALRHLSPEQRTVLELVYFNGLHYDDIAQVVGCPENTVKTRVFHARKRLRALWPSLTGDVASRPPR